MVWNVLSLLLTLLELLIFARVVLSWVANPGSHNPLVEMVRAATEPVLAPIRAILPRTGMFDFSPMIALFLIFVLQGLLPR
jgi:YggT family protein